MEVRKTLPMKVLLSVITTLTLFGADLFAQEFKPFTIRYQETVKGDMLVIGNSILNHGNYPANTPYTGSNGCIGHVILSEIKPGVDLQATATAQYGCAANVIENKIVVKVNPLYTAQVTYALDGGTPTTDPIFRGVSVGMHTITIKHNRGCVVELPVEVELKSPLALTPTQQDVSCHAAADAFVSVAVTGGSGNYQYAISPNLTQFGNSNKFEGLSGGTYIVAVRDTDYGCEVEHTFIVDEPLPLQLNSVNVTDESCYNEKDGTLTFEISGGRADYRYQLINSRGAIHTSQSGISCGKCNYFE